MYIYTYTYAYMYMYIYNVIMYSIQHICYRVYIYMLLGHLRGGA
jgi:hypothetical protein